MNANRGRMAERQPTDVLLLSLVEEAIAESLAAAPTQRAPLQPIGAEAFLADAAAFLAARPDAGTLIRRLQAMLEPLQEAAPPPSLAKTPLAQPPAAQPSVAGTPRPQPPVVQPPEAQPFPAETSGANTPLAQTPVAMASLANRPSTGPAPTEPPPAETPPAGTLATTACGETGAAGAGGL